MEAEESALRETVTFRLRMQKGTRQWKGLSFVAACLLLRQSLSSVLSFSFIPTILVSAHLLP